TLEAALAETAQLSAVQLQRTFGANAERLRSDLDRARQAAADLEAHMQRLAGGARPTSVDELRAALAGISARLAPFPEGGGRATPWAVIFALSANVLTAAVLILVVLRGGPPAPAAALTAPTAPTAPSAVAVPSASSAPDPDARPSAAPAQPQPQAPASAPAK